MRVIKYFCKDKPNQNMRYMIQGLWQIMFSATLEKWNSITHNDVNIVNKEERRTLINELREWKRKGCLS